MPITAYFASGCLLATCLSSNKTALFCLRSKDAFFASLLASAGVSAGHSSGG